MSWQVYVDDHLVGTGKVTKAAIIGQAGGVWAHSAQFDIRPDEQKVIVNAFKDPSEVQASGIRLAGEKFLFTLITGDGVIQGRLGDRGCVLAQTKQAVIVAEYKQAPGISAQDATSVVLGVVKYLMDSGY